MKEEFECCSKKACPSYNTVFPLRIATDPESARGISEKKNQAETPSPKSASGLGR